MINTICVKQPKGLLRDLCVLLFKISRPSAFAPPLHEQVHKAAGKLPSCSHHDRRHPTEKGPGSGPHIGCPLGSTGRISNIGLLFSSGCLSRGFAHHFLLVIWSWCALLATVDCSDLAVRVTFKIEYPSRLLREPPFYPFLLLLTKIHSGKIFEVGDNPWAASPSRMVQASNKIGNAALITNRSQVQARAVPHVEMGMCQKFRCLLPTARSLAKLQGAEGIVQQNVIARVEKTHQLLFRRISGLNQIIGFYSPAKDMTPDSDHANSS